MIFMTVILNLVVRQPKSAISYSNHSTTLSAHIKTFEGIARPSVLAVFRLITNSNFVGCSTGKSAGLAPLRICQPRMQRDEIARRGSVRRT